MPRMHPFHGVLVSQCNERSARRNGPACRMTPLGVAIAGLFALHSEPLWSANITVDGDKCQLREAIDNANSDSNGGGNGCTAGSGDDTLILPVAGELQQRIALPAVTTKITIQGNKAGNKSSIRAVAAGFPLIEVSAGGQLELNDTRLSGASNPGKRGGAILVGRDATLTVRNSIIEKNDARERGGAGGAIANESGRVTLIDTTISGNSATYGGGIHSVGSLTLVRSEVANNRSPTSGGGGIACVGTCTLTDSMVTGNTSARGAGGIFSSLDTRLTLLRTTVSGNIAKLEINDAKGGGGIENRGTATLLYSTVSNNRAGIDGRVAADGGGIYNIGVLTLDRSTVSGNSAATSGGGISNARSGVLYLERSTVDENTAHFNGGGIFSELPDNYGRNGGSYIRHSTISGNVATYQVGGGIYNKLGHTVIDRSTITGNTATAGSGIFSRSHSNAGNYIATFLTASIASGNDGDSDVVFMGPGAPSQGNSFLSDGSNLIGSGDALDAFQAVGDRTGEVDPGLDRLDDYGGPTRTHALKENSLAIDASICDGIVDQRGVNRPKDGNGVRSNKECDIGAFERGTNSVDLFITGSTSASSVPIESLITYTFSVRNLGPDPANGVRFTDALPNSLSFDSVKPSTGTCTLNARTVTCELGDLSAGGVPVTIRLLARAIKAGSSENTATVISDADIDLDANGGNNTRSAVVSVNQPGNNVIPFRFADIPGVPRSTLQTSEPIEVRGINVPVSISVSGGRYSINGGSFTNGSGTVRDGDQIRARHTSSADFGATANTTVTIGTNTGAVSDTFSSTTEAADDTPEIPEVFVARAAVSLGSSQLSNEITVDGINVPVMIRLTGSGSYSINGGPFTREPGRVGNGHKIRVIHTASAEFETSMQTTVIVGGTDTNNDPRNRIAKTFTSTTRARDGAADVKPEIVGTFGRRTDVLRDQDQTSDEITVGGISVPVTVSITGAGGYSIDGGASFTRNQGLVRNGQKVRVRHTSSDMFDTTTRTTVTIGGTSASDIADDKVRMRFETTTGPDEEPDSFDFLDKRGAKIGKTVESDQIEISGLSQGERVEMKLACVNGDVASLVNGVLVPGSARSGIKNRDKIVLRNRIRFGFKGQGSSKCEVTIGQGRDRDDWTISTK